MSLISKLTTVAASGAGGDATIAYVPVVNALVAFDCSDPTNLVELGRITDATYLANPRGVVVDVGRQVAYVSGSAYLSSIDISDPTNMSRLNSSLDGDDAYDLALDTANENLYLVGGADRTLRCFDVSNPSSLSQIDTLYLVFFDNVRGLALDLSTDTLFVGTYEGMVAVDVSNPSSLSYISDLSTGYFGHYGIGLDTTNNVAFSSAYGNDRLLSINISNTASMSVLDDITDIRLDGAWGVSLDLQNDVAYVASDREDAVVSVDISNSSNLSKLDDLADVTNLQNATNTAIDIANSVLYVVAATSDALSSIDISSPSSLSILDTFTFPTENLLGGIALNIDGPNATNAWD